MPCNSDYMNASNIEIEMSRVFCLLDELDDLPWTKCEWDGYHKSAYAKGLDKESRDSAVSRLCARLQDADVSKFSLEMQMWWRDHQAADKARIAREMKEIKRDSARAEAIAKLSAYERKLLGV